MYSDNPPFVFYGGFEDEWDGFSARQRETILEFLEDLQCRYDQPGLQKDWNCEKRGRYWAARLPSIEFRIFWTVVYDVVDPIEPHVKEIRVVAVEPIPGRR